MTNKIYPCLWFDGQARAAAEFYCSIFPDSKITTETPMVVTFELNSQQFMGLNGGPQFQHSEAVSFVVDCQGQEEVNHYWDKLTADGGQESMCGWLKDKFGVSWQIVPDALPRLLSDPDPAKAQRVMDAMLKMRKIDVVKLAEAAGPSTTALTVSNTVNAPVEKVWRLWTGAEHIRQWNNASDDWHTPKAENDLRTGGNFVFTMAAKDGSFSFDFGGTYDEVIENQKIAYTIGDGRKVEVIFRGENGQTQVIETFDAENVHSLDMQRAGWQAILDNFKKYAETTA